MTYVATVTVPATVQHTDTYVATVTVPATVQHADTYVATVTVPATDLALCSTQTVLLQVLCHY
jgi:hypothetical protein